MKNKLAASTLAFQDWTLEDAAEACRRNGIDALEIRMNFHSWSNLALPDSEYERMYQFLHNKGLAVSDLATGIRINGYMEEKLEELERCSQVANLLCCRGLRIMIGNKRKRWSDEVPGIDMDGITDWLIEAEEILKRYNTQIWIETHDEFATGKAQRALLNRYPFEHVKLLWDIMHPLESGEKPEDTLKYMGKDLVHVHIKDGTPWPDADLSSWKYTRIGEGSVPIRDIVSLILSTGYEGYFSLEWESSWRPEIRGEGFEVDKMLAQYHDFMEKC